MLAFLHTARVHVEAFDRLAHELDSGIPVLHEIHEHLLADVLSAGGITGAVRSATADVVQKLVRDGAKVVVCTCSTIGAVAEATEVSNGAQVIRIDRPMAEQAVASGRHIVVVAALHSTLDPTVSLLQQVASRANRSISVEQVLCEHAWPLFERGDHAGYMGEIAAAIEATARATDLILLAQASMAPAVERLGHLGIPILSSPKLGLAAAMAAYRAANA